MAASNKRFCGFYSHCRCYSQIGDAFTRDIGKETNFTCCIPWFIAREYERAFQSWAVLVAELVAGQRLQKCIVRGRYLPNQ